MDEGPHTADTGANKTLQPSADSSIQWYSGGFADIADKSTANYIEADKDSGDNSDSDVFTLEDFTLPAGSIVTGVSASLNGYDDFGTGRTTVSLTKNGAWMTNTSVLPVAAYSNVFWNFNTVTDMPTQTDINNMLIGFKASLSTSHDYLDVYHAYVDIYYTNFTIRDYKGNNHIYALGGVGKGVKFYSYAE